MVYKGLRLVLMLSIFGGLVFAQNTRKANFYFESDISVLAAKEQQKFKQFIVGLDSTDVISISLIGYCDDIGRKGYNDTLSVMRASHIKTLLQKKGYQTEKVSFLAGNGKVDLKSKTNVEDQRAQNRRVEIIVVYSNRDKVPLKPKFTDTLKVGDKLTFRPILFEDSKSVFSKSSLPILEKLAQDILIRPNYSFIILGHICCNPPGKDVLDWVTGKYNLSEARARVIFDYLVSKGVEPQRLSYKGMMANEPLGKGDLADRRVEVVVTAIKGKNAK